MAAAVLGLVASAPASAAVSVYFPRGEQMVAVQREGTTVQDAMRALLRGPTADERRQGFRTYIATASRWVP